MPKNNPPQKGAKDAKQDHEIWSAIRYLDPDQEERAHPFDAAVRRSNPSICVFLVSFIV